MHEDDDTHSPYPILACGHAWDGTEAWADMLVVLKETLDAPEGPQPAYSAGHYCRACRERIVGERFASPAETEACLRRARAERTTTPSADTLLRNLPPDWWLDVECPCDPRGPGEPQDRPAGGPRRT